jgi:hypothetical protein
MDITIVADPALWKMFFRSLGINTFTSYSGTPTTICKKIVRRCYNGKYYMVSRGHFQNFYVRDFGMCTEALLDLGYGDYVVSTLSYALSLFKRHEKITTTINAYGVPKDFFDPGIDSLPFLLRSLRLALEHPDTKHAARSLRKKYKDFLERQISLFARWIDPDTGLVRPELRLSTIKDHHNRPSSCYENCMAGMLSDEADRLHFYNSLSRLDHKALLRENFYNGEFFEDDLCSSHISGDANIFPFYCGIIDDIEIFRACLKAIRKEGLDSPFPLQYTKRPHKVTLAHFADFFAPNYEGDTIWMHLGLCYLYVLQKFRPTLLKDYLDSYNVLIARHKNFLEVFNADGAPYKRRFYVTDHSMSWAVMYLHLQKLLKESS